MNQKTKVKLYRELIQAAAIYLKVSNTFERIFKEYMEARRLAEQASKAYDQACLTTVKTRKTKKKAAK